jgi:glycosyltransferase involved in cell wall biosynthesis
MSINKKILYISYDGMTDALGQSQVLPYLIGLSKVGYQFTILSFEKKDKYLKLKQEIGKICSDAGIIWVPLSFTATPPVISKFYDAVRMRLKAFSLYKKQKFDMIHCRSYLAAEIGLRLKREKKTKFFFDMRGFWADEKKDAGTWKQSHLIFRKVYQHYKKKETQFVSEADYIISLTDAGRKEIMKWPAYNPEIPLKVIPCCSDMDHFTLTSAAEKKTGRQTLGLPVDKLIISYLGSIGAWYLLDEMLDFFSCVKQKYSDAIFLFITHSEPEMIKSKLATYNLNEKDIMIVGATRSQVPVYTKASDVNISFIRPDYSKISSSPTKLGEVLAMGIPVIVNTGVGDVEAIVDKTGSGIVLKEFNKAEYIRAVDSIPELLRKDAADIRKKSEEINNLTIGIKKYKEAYDQLFGNV